MTSAKDKNAVGVTGFYGLVVGADCRFELVKTGSRGSVVSTFREGDEQRGSGVLTPAGGGRWALDAHIANADRGYDARFDLELGKVLSGTWRYTGASFEKTGYRGTVEGTRAR
ncbi:MAG: hypothetical protein H6745_04895 [Deltaproteobacteria bacterium]|nr:hypothetical protein [Deltaproteobacteria bacterium]